MLSKIDHLIEQLGGSASMRMQASQALVKIGDPVVVPLLTILDPKQTKPTVAAIKILGQLNTPEAIFALEDSVISSNPLVGSTAVDALAKLAPPNLAILLTERYPYAHLMTQQTILKVLGEHGDRQAVMPLIQLLPTCQSPTMLCGMIQTLGKLGDPRAISAVQVYANDPDRHVRDWVAAVVADLS